MKYIVVKHLLRERCEQHLALLTAPQEEQNLSPVAFAQGVREFAGLT